ncbi:hypothetical protein NBRC116494_00160 [Aurantivibrio plasticivorans]
MDTPYLLALDLGTSSIGYVAFALDDSDEPKSILDLGVRIFPDGRHPKTKEPLAVSRRIARGIRRNRDRGQNRVRRLVKELIEFGLFPVDERERKKVFDTVSPYYARAAAAQELVDKETLGRAIFHIGRRRGFKSNRLAGESEESEFKEKISELRNKLEGKTLGEYLFEREKQNQALAKDKKAHDQKPFRFRNGETDFYADRQMYLDEFERIKAVQGNIHLNDEQWAALKETAFWQYPLKPVPKGKCRYYPEENRAHIDLPISHDYRIYQEVNSLRYQSQNIEYSLDDRQRKAVYDYLRSHKTMTFKQMLKLKEQKSPLFPSDAQFNLDVASRNGKLMGNKTLVDFMKKELLGAIAEKIDYVALNGIADLLIEPLEEINGKKVVMETEKVALELKKRIPNLSDEQIENLCNYRFKRDTAGVSRKFMEQINPVMRDQGLVYSDAVAQLKDDNGHPFNHTYGNTGEVLQRLPYYGEVMPESVWGAQPEADKNKSPLERDDDAYQYGKIANPTVHVALNQLRVVVNRVIDKLGSVPAKIHAELTRDLKNSKDAREQIEKQQRKNKIKNDEIRRFLVDELGIINPSRRDFQKVKLWEELGKQGARFSVFSGQCISASQLFNGEVEIEHIVPFSRCYDDGMANKTLAFKNENNQKGNLTPHEAFAGAGSQYSYDDMLKRALSVFGQTSKYERFKEDAYERFYGGEKGDMIARQLNDTKYISRKAHQYLSCLCTQHNVVSVNGMMTAVLRDVWQLNNFKDRATGHYREDHRHHIVDAFVVGLTSRSLINRLNTRRSTVDQTQKDLYHFLKSRVNDIPELKKELFKKLDLVVASYKPDRTQTGSMFNDTAYGIKSTEDDTKYVTRKAITALTEKEVLAIRDSEIRQNLIKHLTGRLTVENLREFKVSLGPGKDFIDKKASFAKKTGINKVRINVPNTSIEAIKSASYKGYGKNSYAFCDVWMIPHKKDKKSGEWLYRFEGDFVAFADAKHHDPESFKVGRHPAMKKLVRIYKQDCFTMTNKLTGEAEHIRIAGYDASKNKLDVRENLKAVNEKQNHISINTLFSNHQFKKLRL